jgi:hypothetical protein
MRTEPTNNGTLVGSRDGFWIDPPKQRRQFYRECRENTWALCRGRLRRPLAAAVPLPLFTSDKREASLVGGNCGIQKCDSVDPLSLVIKCLVGGVQVGGLGSPDYQQTTLSLWRPSQHTHIPTVAALVMPLIAMALTFNEAGDLTGALHFNGSFMIPFL